MVHEMENDILAQFPNLALYVKNRAFAAEMKIFLEIPKKKEFVSPQDNLLVRPDYGATLKRHSLPLAL